MGNQTGAGVLQTVTCTTHSDRMNSSTTQNIMIADAQFLVVHTLQSLIGSKEQYHMAGVAWNRYELNELLSRVGEGLLIIDPAGAGFEGLTTIKKIRELHPEVIVFVLTNTVSKEEVSELTKLGIRNIWYKTVEKEELLYAIENAFKGKKSYSSEFLEYFLSTGANTQKYSESKLLTGSEKEIVKLIVGGLTTKEIAARRNISHHTVNAHRKNIFRKAEVTNTSELIMHAIKSGWIDNIEYYI